MSSSEETQKPIISPFSKASATVPDDEEPASQKSKLGLIFGIVLGILVLLVGGFWISKSFLNDPYRTLENFSVDKYMSDYRALQGGRYKAIIKVQSNLGYDENVGKLMSFKTETDSRAFVVLIPTDLGAISFTKGQTYTAELEVKDGGLIYAKACRKN